MKPGEVQLWRIANTSGRSGAFFLGPPPGFNWRQIAQDGVQFEDANYQSSLNKPFMMASGNRVDLLVQAPTTPAIYPVIVQPAVDPSDLRSAYPVTLVSVRIKATDQRVTGQPSQFIPTAPKPPAFLADITDAEVKGTRTINFASTGPGQQYSQHTINGKKFDGLGNAQQVFLNTVEEWKITNQTASPNISHPFHIHVNPFQITEVFNPNVTVPNPNSGPAAAAEVHLLSGRRHLLPGSATSTPRRSIRTTRRSGPTPIPTTERRGSHARRLLPRRRPGCGGTFFRYHPVCWQEIKMGRRFRGPGMRTATRPASFLPVTSRCAAASSTIPATSCSTATSWRTRTAA